jgi:hypothetical protein
MTGKSSDSELDSASPKLARFVRYLASSPLEDRPKALQAYLSGMEKSDADALTRAIAAIDPDGEAPEQDAWGAHESGIKLVRASEIQEEPVEWLWSGRVPHGALTMFAGDPKVGKSLVTIQLTASVSSGNPLPCDCRAREPGQVILLSAEDDHARTISPRLRAAGAELGRIHLVQAVELQDGYEALPNLQRDLAKIASVAARMDDLKLIIVDPVTAYLGGLDDHRNSEIRSILAPLNDLARKLNIAVVLVSHLAKADGRKAKYRVLGSIGYVASCRANFLFMLDPQDPSGTRRLMLANGGNLARDAETLAFTVGGEGAGAKLVWEPQPLGITVDEALATESSRNADPLDPDEEDECQEWLRQTLESGPMPAPTIISLGKPNCFTEGHLKRAKKKIGAKSRKTSLRGGWEWYLPSAGAGQQETDDEGDSDEEAAEEVAVQGSHTFDSFGPFEGEGGDDLTLPSQKETTSPPLQGEEDGYREIPRGRRRRRELCL